MTRRQHARDYAARAVFVVAMAHIIVGAMLWTVAERVGDIGRNNNRETT